MMTLNSALDTVMQLEPEERNDLIEILQKRQSQEWRKGTADYYYDLKQAFTDGKVKPLSVNEALDELHNYLNTPD